MQRLKKKNPHNDNLEHIQNLPAGTLPEPPGHLR
jgi:hypothetical protein